ncbi:MAG: hypothetical protein IPK01_03605 [Acidobacteria bacterium]|nr:hypothetical protein [Acidobacteriota bacterium]
MAALGLVTFFHRPRLYLERRLPDRPKKGLADRSSDADSQRRLDGITGHYKRPKTARTRELVFICDREYDKAP